MPEPVKATLEVEKPIFERPERLYGFTDMIKLFDRDGTQHSYLVTVNSTPQGQPVEVILTAGRAGNETNADSEALGRVVSIALQYGVPVEALVHTLRGINGGLYGTYNESLVTSKADLIAVALESLGPAQVGEGLPLDTRSLRRPEGDRPPGEQGPQALCPEGDRPLGVRASASPEGDRPPVSASTTPGMEVCPSCKTRALVREEGCRKCQACGWSKCG